MKLRFRTAPVLFLALTLLLVAAAGAAAGSAKAKHYVCPPCGASCDAGVFDKPGVCPKCGMTLVDADEAKAAAATQKKVAFLLFDGAEVIDFAGPYEMFGVNCDVYTVGEAKTPLPATSIANSVARDAPRLCPVMRRVLTVPPAISDRSASMTRGCAASGPVRKVV